MGNEASLEGGEGGLAGLPEGIVSDGKGGFIQIPAGTEADLSKLSEEERKQIAAVMSKAQTKAPGSGKDAPTQRTSEVDAIQQPRQPGKPPTQGPTGLSKSRTVDAFRTGPAARQAPPGRSPSSLSLLESLSRQEAKEETRSGMFSSNFLSGANPLSAVSSAVNKFSLFGDEGSEEEKKQKAAAQQVGKPGQQAGSAKASPQPQQGPSKQGQGPHQQRGPLQQAPGKPGPTPQPGPQGPQQQTAPKGGPQPQGPTKPGSQQQQGPTKPGSQQQGPTKPGPQPQGPAKPGPQPQGPAKPGPQQQGPAKPGPQQQGPTKPGPQQQGPTKPGPQQQGPAKPEPQQQGPTKPGPQQQGPTKPGSQQQQGPTKPGPQQQGPTKPGPQQQQGPSKPGSQQQQGPDKPGLCQQGPSGAGAQSAGPAKTGAPPSGTGFAGPKQSQGTSHGAAGQKSTCPLCNTTVLSLHSKEQPNYNTCTQCKTVVCSLCGFSPPDSAGKEWLCLNCQMQRALGGMDAPTPSMTKPQPQPSKTPSAPESPSKKQAVPEAQGHKPEVAKPSAAKKPSPLKKQQTLSDTGKPGTPPSTPPAARKGPAQAPEKGTGPQEPHKPLGTQRPPDQPGLTGAKQDTSGPQSASPAPHAQVAQKPPQQPSVKPAQQQDRQTPDHKPSGGAVKTDPKAGHLVQESQKSQQQIPKGGAGPSPAKSGPPQAQPPPQPPKQESSFFGLSFGGFSEPPKPQPTTPQPTESVSGKLFGFGGFSEAPKQPAVAPPAESVSGKMFGFGSSIFSSASSLISTAVQDEPPAPSKEPAPAQPSPKKPPATEVKPSPGQKPEQSQQAKPTPPTQEKKTVPGKAEKPPSEPPKVGEPPLLSSKAVTSNCPLCKVDLNVGSKNTPNYNTCTECKKIVCNLCGFNPMPHLNEKEWLCLNCQTQRALAGQLGDLPPPMPAPSKPANQQPAPTKLQASPVKQSALQMAGPVTSEPSSSKPAPLDQNTRIAESASPASPAIAPKPATFSPAKEPTRLAKNGQIPLQDHSEKARTVEIIDGAKKPEAETGESQKEPTGETKENVDKKSGVLGSSEVNTGSLSDSPSIIPSDKNKLLKEPVKKDADAPVTSPTSPSDLAKLESTVLSILEAQTSTVTKENAGTLHDQKQDQPRPKTLPISAGSFCSEEGELEDAGEVGECTVKDAPSLTAPKKERKKLHVLPEGRQHYDSFEDSSESEPSPLLQRRRKISAASTSSEEYQQDSPGSGDEEDFIRKQIMEMSADEDGSEDEDNYVRKQIKEEEEKREQDGKNLKCKSTSGKSKRLLKKSSVSHEPESGRRHSWQESEEQECAESPDSKKRETKSQEGEESSIDNGGGLRRFRTIELNNTTASPYKAGAPVRQGTEEGELEMESLTDSPEDRSRGESSSLHASSFTPGTSPTSVSSFDEDSDSSPSHKRTSGEGKQHRKARHRQHGQVLPTIEDSSEEEEIREEEELLREQEKQREVDQQQVKKSSGKKSKKDKEELRAQRRREHPKTPPSNLSPIEDASPTEELRQAAEMEELHKSSCSEYSPSIESEPEGFEIHPDKIIAVQKVYKLPTSVSLYSPTEEQNAEMTRGTMDKSLKSADEAYEEMMQNVKTLQGKKETEDQLEKEPLYGGMLIEDYIYESLIENKVTGNCVGQKQESSKISVQEPEKKLRSPDEVYEDMQRKKDNIPKEQGLQQMQPDKKAPQPQKEMDLTVITCKPTYVNSSTSDISPSGKDGKPLLDAEAAYEELMKRQRVILTPGTSPTQPVPELNDMVLIASAGNAKDTQGGVIMPEALVRGETPDVPVSSVTSPSKALFPIPDLKITQCSSGEEDVEEDSIAQKQEKVKPGDIPQADQTVMIVEQASVGSAQTPVSPSVPSAVHVTAPAVAPGPVAAPTPVPVPVSGPEAAAVPSPVPSEISPSSPPPPPPLPQSVTKSSAMAESPHAKTAACVSTLVSAPLDLTASPSQTAQTVVLGMESMVEDLSKPRSSVDEKFVSEPIRNMPATPTLPPLPPVIQPAKEPVVGSDISMTSVCPVTGVISLKTTIASVSAIPTVPHYAPTVSSIMSTAVSATVSATQILTSAPPIPPKPAVLLRGSSQEKADIDVSVPPPPPPPPPPPLPPPILPKPAVYPKKPCFSTPSIMPTVASVSTSTSVTVLQAATAADLSATFKSAVAPSYRPHVPPPVPPKPASIPAGLTFSHKPGESMKPPVAPKPAVIQPATQLVAITQQRPASPPSTTAMILNLSTPVEPSATSPKSPLSPRYGNSLHETYVVITLPSEPGTPVEGIITQAPISPALVSPMKPLAQTAVPVAFTHYTKSIEIQGTDKVVSSMSQMYSSMSTSTQPVVPLPNLVAQVLTTEVQRTTVSVVREKLPVTPLVPATRTAGEVVTVTPETPKAQPKPRENGKTCYSGGVVDLRTLKQDGELTDKGLDLSATDSRGHSLSADASGRQTSAVQSVIVNLSTEALPVSSSPFMTDSITIVTCTATISGNNGAGNKPLNLGHTSSVPLQLTTSRSFEPVAQIVYRPIDSQPTTHFNTEAPINLSFGAITSAESSRSPVTPASLSDRITGHPGHTEVGLASAVDLTTTKPIQTMVAVNGSNSAVVTTVVEDDGKPVDLTAGKRVVCCDVVYKLPFAGSCTTQQPTTALPEDRFGYRDDHYQYNRSGPYGMKSFGGMKSSMSDTNLAEAGLFFYKSKNSYDYQSGATEGAVDLTSGKMSTGEVMDYSSKGTGAYSSVTVPQYSQARITPVVGTHFGTNSMLRSSNGVVYSSVAAPIPSTYAITTQPGSIFSTTYNALSGMHTSDTMPSLSSLQDHPLPRSYSFFTTTAAEKQAAVSQEIALSKEGLSTAFTGGVTTATTMPGSYTDASLEAIAASLEALASPMVPASDESTQQYQMEREFLEMEKMKQLRLAEELEWERQEIQRFREQEQLMVQKELEELQTIKQQLLFQQEEERQAHLMMQQETYAQQQLQLEQIQQLQQQLQQQLEEQKMRQMFPYDPPTTSEQALLEAHYAGRDGGQYWPEQDQSETPSTVGELQQNATWYTVPTEGVAQYIPNLPETEIPLKELEGQELLTPHTDRTPGQYDEQGTDLSNRKIVESGVQTDEEDGVDKACTGRRKRNKRSVDSSVQTDDEDQDEWDIPTRSRRRSRSSKPGSKVSSIAIQTVAEISVQTDHSGTIKRPAVRAQVDTKLEIKQITSPEKTYRGGSTNQAEVGSGKTSPQKDKRRPIPLEIGHSTHLKADSSLQVVPSPPKSPKVLYSPISPLSPSKSLDFVQYEKSVGDSIPQKMLTTESSKPPPTSPRTLKAMQRSLSDPKPQSPTSEERTGSNFQYSDGHSGKGSQSSTPSGTQKKVKRTLPNPPAEEESAASQTGYSTGSARRRLCRNTNMARAKILQDIDRELDLVERESSKLRKKQAELDEEEKEIDAKLRYLEMGINRRKDALLKEREKRERAYLQGVAEDRDYMSDSEVSNIRETRGNGHGLERPRTAPQSEFNQFIPPQTQPEAQYAQSGGSYSQYPYAPQTQATTQYPQQTLYQPPSLYHQQVSPYQSQSIYSSVPSLSYPQSSHQQSQQQSYQHTSQMLLMQQKARQTTLSDLETKITTNYEVIRSQPHMMGSSSTDTSYSLPHLAGKYSSLDLRLGLEERGSMASSPMSSISADSFYADIDHHTPRNYVLIDDIGELTKSSAGLSSSFTIPDKDLAKADRLLRAAEARRSAEVTDFLGPLQASSRLHSYNKPEEDAMEEPYELKLLKQQIKQEFRRGSEALDPLTGLPHYYPGESGYRHFPKTEKYSISRLTLEKQAAKQLPASVLYQKQAKHKKALMDPKITKFSPIQEGKDLEPDYSSYLASSASSVSGLSSRAKLLQDELTFGLRKNITEQQKYLGSTLGANLAQSFNLGQSLNLSPNLRTSLQEDAAYPSGSRSRPSSRPSSVYGLDLSLKRDLSSSSLRLKTDGEALDSSFTTPSVRTKPTSLPISQSRGRIPIVAQNSEEESPLSPVGQPMGMARASAGPLPPISADSRDQFGSSHSLPEVQQHMREESRTRGYDRDIAFMMDDLQGAMSDSEALSDSLVTLSRDDPRYTHEHMKDAYHLRREETDWFDKPHEGRLENGHGPDRRQIKSIHYPFPHTRIKLLRDPKDHSVSGNGLGIRVVGGKDIPGNNGDIGAYIAKVLPGGAAELTGKIVEGMQVLEWNGISLTGKTYEEVQSLVSQQCGEAELCLRLDLNMMSDSEHPEHLELHDQSKHGDKQRSPGVDPKQLAAELQKVSQQQAPSSALSVSEKGPHIHSGTASAASSAIPSPGQPGSPSVSKKKHSSKSAESVRTQPHPITGEIQLQINYDKNLGNLIVHVLQARNLPPRDNNGYSDPFVKVYLLPGRGAENKRRTKHAQKSLNPEWNQTVIYKNIHLEQIKKKTLEVTVWDYDRLSSNDFLGEVLIDLSNTVQLDNIPRWFLLKEQSESQEQARPHSSQGSQASPKPSVIKSRSHGVFPDPSKDMQVPTIEKSHSSPGSSKPSSEGHARSHGSSRGQSKSGVAQPRLQDAGVTIAAAEAAVQQLRLQPIHKSSRTKKHHRHSVAGVPTIHRTQSDYLPAPANEMKDTSQLTVRKMMSEGTPKKDGARSGHRATDAPATTTSSTSSLASSGLTLDEESGTNAVDSAIFQVPRIGKTILNGTDKTRGSDALKPSLGLSDTEAGKTQMMGEIKIALKKEMKTEGEQLIVEILQCRNITYKFKTPDHLPDLYVKLYVVNVATQKRIIKKKTRVCRHDREPSFNETFRFSMNPAGHSIQLFLVSNGGKFVKKTLIGEAYIWLDKVDLRKRSVSWHKLLASSTQAIS